MRVLIDEYRPRKLALYVTGTPAARLLNAVGRGVIRARSNRIEDLILCIPDCIGALERIGPGEVVRVGRVLRESGSE